MVSNAERLVGIAERYDRQLEGLDAETLKRISDAYDISYRTLIEQLRDAYPRLQEAGSVSSLVQQGAIAAELREALEFINPGNTEEYRRLGETVIQQSSDLGQRLAGDSLKRLGVQSTFTTIPLDAVRFQAERFTKSLVNYSNRQAGQISAVVEQGLIQGWGVRKTEQGLKALGVSFKSNAETVARTEIQSAYVNSSMARYEKSGIDKVIWIATPSDRLCSYCAAKNGLMYRSKDVVFPPHPRCRCTTLPGTGLTAEDAEYYKSYREQTLQELKDAGGKPDNGLTPFEKAAGLTSPPKPVWEPGQPLPKDVGMPQPPPPPPPPPKVTSVKPNQEYFDKWADAYQNTPEGIRRVIDSLPYPEEIPSDGTNGAYHRRGKIHMGHFEPGNKEGDADWRTEYGKLITRHVRRNISTGN